MAVLGATGICTLDNLRASLAQCLAWMAGKGIIVVGCINLVWLAYILTKIKDKLKRAKETKDKAGPHRQIKISKRKETKIKQKNKEVCKLLDIRA
jgi:hypothetical protein